MSSFTGGFEVPVPGSEVMKIGCSVIEEMDLIPGKIDGSMIVFREKMRFDPFNPVEIRLEIESENDHTMVKIEVSNEGIGSFQETHVRRKALQIIERIESEISLNPRTEEEHPEHGEIEMLSRLHSMGVLTDVEFERAKMKVLCSVDSEMPSSH